MTNAPSTLVNLQNRLVTNLHTVNSGIVGDDAHVATGGYHIGATTLRRNGMGNDYSLYYAIDKNATHDWACAIDIGGTPEKLMTIGNRIVHALKNHDRRVYGRIRAVNAPFDGVSIDRRLDDESPTTSTDDNVQASSDRGHIHVEFYRTLVLNQKVMDDFYDVCAGISGDDMSAADVAAIKKHIDESQAAQSKEIRRVELLIIKGRADDPDTAANETIYGLQQLSADMAKVKKALNIQ